MQGMSNETQLRKKNTGEPTANGGHFGSHTRADGDVTLGAGSRLETMTPVEIDTELAAYIKEISPVKRELWAKTDFIIEAQAFKKHMEDYPNSDRYRFKSWKFDNVDEKITAAEAAQEALMTRIAEFSAEHIAPLENEYERRGWWSRFFLVTSSNGGHVHSSRSCSTCNPRTQFVWLVDEAGKSEDEIVGRAGDGACTVCFSTAPVADKSNPRPNPFEDPEMKAARELRAQEKAARDAEKAAKGIFSPTGEPVRDHSRREFKTERAAENYVISEMENFGYYERQDPDHVAKRVNAMADVQVALVHKRGVTPEEVRTAWEKKVKAKAKRDGMNGAQEARMLESLAKVNACVDGRERA